MTDFLVVIVLLALLGFWWDSLGARQAARLAGRRVCEREGVQFLDDTVAISRLRLQRDSRGRNLLGKKVLGVELGWQEF